MSAKTAREETSAGGVVFRREDGRSLFLLIRDSYRNWGFPKGHLEPNEPPAEAALREVREETGLEDLSLCAEVGTIDWYFRFRGRLIHKICHFYLMEAGTPHTRPQRDEGITACRWLSLAEARSLISYDNARLMLDKAATLVNGEPAD